MNDPTPDNSSEDLKFCIKSDGNIEDENDEEEVVNVGIIGSIIKNSLERASPQQMSNHFTNVKTPQSDQTKDKSSDSEEKEYKAKSKHGRNKVEMDENGKPYNTGRWTDEEHRRFMEGIEIYGKDWKKVQQHVGTRSSAQSRSHAQKVLAKSYYSKSLSGEYSCKQEWIQVSEDIEKCNKFEKNMDKKMDGIKESNKIKTPIPSPKKSPIVSPPVFQRRIDFSIENNIEKLASNNIKRKCTIDISKNDNELLMIEDDEVSNKLLRKLTTPKPTAKLMSFSYNDLPRLNFNLDSDSESFIEDDFAPKSPCGLLSLNDFVVKSINHLI